MSTATQLMAQYAAYHRDRRNIATHFVGIPLIVFAVGALLARPSIAVAGAGGWALTPAAILWGLSSLWYLTRGSLALLEASSARGESALKPRPGGIIRPFCEPATETSTPHSSCR